MSYLLKGGLIATFTKDGPRTFKADVLVEGSTITKIEENLPTVPAVETIDCTNKWITPGMVDTHRHLWMTILRAEHDNMLLTEYLVKNSWTVQPEITVEEARVGQFAGCLDALHCGVTTILDHFHVAWSPEHTEAAIKVTIESGARVVFCPARQSVPTRVLPHLQFDKDEETSKWQVAQLQKLGARDAGKLTPDGRVLLGLAYDVVRADNMPTHQEIFKIARSIPVHIITAHIVKGPGILTHRDGGLLGPDIVFSHCNELWYHTELDDEQWAAMKEHGCAIGSTPVDEIGMAHGLPPTFEAVERGVKCGLGADSTSINSGDLIMQMRIALQFHRGRSHEKIWNKKQPPPLGNKYNSADAFRLATLGGAEALNLSHLIGSVEVGKKADLVIYDARSVNLAGSRDPFNGIVFHASNADIDLVMVDGNILKRDGKLTKVEWATVAEELYNTAEGIWNRYQTEALEERWQAFHAANPGFSV